MVDEAVLTKVQDLMVELFDVGREKVGLDARLVEDLGLCSIDAIDLVVNLEEFTGRKVGQKELLKVRTVGDIVALVQAQLATPAGQG